MLVRLLLVVLILAGQSPAGACTCAASTSTPEPTSSVSDFSAPLSSAHATETGCSKCRAKAASSAGRFVAATTAPTCTHDGDGHRHPAPGEKPHDRGCPAVNPPQTVAAASPAPDLPTADTATLAIAPGGNVPAPARVRYDCGLRRHSGTPPLYISLLTLRI